MHELRSLSRSTIADQARHRVHRPLPDPPLRSRGNSRETTGALHNIVKGRQGALHRRLLHVCLAVAELQHTAEIHGWTQFVAMPNQYAKPPGAAELRCCVRVRPAVFQQRRVHRSRPARRPLMRRSAGPVPAVPVDAQAGRLPHASPLASATVYPSDTPCGFA
jgi:hypothetical protein